MKKFGLLKKEKLCSVVAIEQLFGPDGADFSRLAYPIRAVARQNPRRSSDAPIAFFISVPKKRLRHAVDRVKIRRRIREAFRLNKHKYPLSQDARIDMAFVYVGRGLESYYAIERGVCKILDSLSNKYPPCENSSSVC